MRLPPRSSVLFEDESVLLLFPPLQAAWAPRGQDLPVLLSGRNAARVLFGAIHLLSGHRILLSQPRQQAVQFQEFLDVLRWHYRGWHPVLLLDENPSHTADESLSTADELDIELLFLPNRAPELNGMDQLWRRGKQTISANRQYATIEEQADRFTNWLLRLSDREARHKAGILSENFWLRDYLVHSPSTYG
jgi:hypothetical protein